MKIKFIMLLLISVLALSACGQSGMDEPVTLLNQNNEEVTFPTGEPVVFFFMTSYTWGICQQQLVQLHENLDKLEGIDVQKFIISKDKPENQLELYTQIEEYYGESLPFVSDENLEFINHMEMKNGDTAYRGYALIDGDGRLVFNTINDHWGEQIDKTIEEIKDELGKLN